MAIKEIIKAATEPATNIVNPPTRSVGAFFGATLDFWFSNRMKKYAEKQIMDELALRKFREELEAEFAKIPEEELVPPRKALLLPALDAAEYYVEEEELRRMFARLIAATCDMRKASKVNPSFAGIIQQLSPLDAENLEYIYREITVPILGLSSKDATRETGTLFLGDLTKHERTIGLQITSYSALVRLGLVNNIFCKSITTDERREFKALERIVEHDVERKERAIRGYALTTTIGDVFCKVCLPEDKS